MGQNTGMLKHSKNVKNNEIRAAFVDECQNLNSGKRRMNGRNSSFADVGSEGPSSSDERKERK